MVAQVARGGTSSPWWHKKTTMESCYDYLANGNGGMTRWRGAHGGTNSPWIGVRLFFASWNHARNTAEPISLRSEKLMINSKANLMPRNQIPLIWPAVAKFATTRTEKLMINSKGNLTYLNQFPRFATTQAPFVVCDPIQKKTLLHASCMRSMSAQNR